MDPKTYNLKDDDLDVNELICDIFDYLLELDGEAETDDDIKKTEQEQQEYAGKQATITIETIDDSKKKAYNKLYFNGECDSNQTRYEFLSNQCNICTTAKTDKVGKALHTFLRQIIDDHPEDFFLYVFEGPDNDNKWVFTVQEMVDLLAEYNSNYSHICDPRKTLCEYSLSEIYGFFESNQSDLCDPRAGLYYDRKLTGYKREINIHRFLPDVDVWNIYRIASALGIWDHGKQYIYSKV